MTGHSEMIWLERHDDDLNMHRFYALELTRDLFGQYLLTRRWGRVGRGGGQFRVAAFDTKSMAEEVAEKLRLAKQKRGYA